MFSDKSWQLKGTLRVMAIMFVGFSTNLCADNDAFVLNIKPDRCIALHQGQTCYARLSFQWNTPAGGEYCLFDERLAEPLACWPGNKIIEFKHEFASDINVNYHIRSKQSQQSLAQALVKISWVYKANTGSSSRWRLF